MKALTFTVLALTSLSLALGCEDARMNNVKATRTSREMIPERVYTISCEMGVEWVKYQTKRHPSLAFSSRSGVWSFLTTDEKSVWSSKCSAVISAE